MFFLYVKTHNKTGLKYLGQTTHDPFKYHGSGFYWKRHLRVHGLDISTEIVGEYKTKVELKEAGEIYSKIWNVVDSAEWANLKTESGDGGDPGPVANKKISHKIKKLMRQQVRDGTFHFLDSELQSELSRRGHAKRRALGIRLPQFDSQYVSQREQKKVQNGTHHFLGGEIQRRLAKERVRNGTHHFIVKVTCPHCNKNGGSANMHRYHFENCPVKTLQETGIR